MESGRICRRCLTRDMAGKEEYFRNLQEYIANIDIDIKTDKDRYEERLDLCRECDLLLEGMCRTCGCYVELRAAMIHNTCPNQKW